MPTESRLSPSAVEYINLLVDHQDGPSDESSERLDDLWEQLDEPMQAFVRGVSSDLNWLKRGGQPAPRARSASEVTDADRQRLVAAIRSKSAVATLAALRSCADQPTKCWGYPLWPVILPKRWRSGR